MRSYLISRQSHRSVVIHDTLILYRASDGAVRRSRHKTNRLALCPHAFGRCSRPVAALHCRNCVRCDRKARRSGWSAHFSCWATFNHYWCLLSTSTRKIPWSSGTYCCYWKHKTTSNRSPDQNLPTRYNRPTWYPVKVWCYITAKETRNW